MRSDTTIVAPDADALAIRLAEWLIGRLAERAGQATSLVLAGGNTPLALYRHLAQPAQARRIDWSQVHLFWGDERWVHYTDPDSNYGAAYQALIRHVPVPAHHVHPIPVLGSPAGAAHAYALQLQAFHGAAHLDPERPLFDIVLLGVGTDGHTASLFPGSPALQETRRWACEARPAHQLPRITLTLPALASTHALVFLAAGVAKQPALQGIRAGDQTLPAALIQPVGERFWFLDSEAAS